MKTKVRAEWCISKGCRAKPLYPVWLEEGRKARMCIKHILHREEVRP